MIVRTLAKNKYSERTYWFMEPMRCREKACRAASALTSYPSNKSVHPSRCAIIAVVSTKPFMALRPMSRPPLVAAQETKKI